MTLSSLQYHQKTSYDRHAMTGSALDWAHQPRVFKEYHDLKSIALPKEGLTWPDQPLSALLKTDMGPLPSLGIKTLSAILHLANGLTAQARHAEEDFFYRSAASAGALYPTELYFAAWGLKGLDDGLYYWSIREHALIPLRKGALAYYTSDLINPDAPIFATLTFFLTAIFFRSAWKYRDRAYRYHLLDTGHVLENLCLALNAFQFPGAIHFDFDDKRCNQLLGVDPLKEVCLGLVQVKTDTTVPKGREEPIPLLSDSVTRASIVSEKEVNYPIIRDIHGAGEVHPPARDAPRGWAHDQEVESADWTALDPSSLWPESMPFAQALAQRRSRRNFIKQPLPGDQMTALLDAVLTEDIPGQSLDPMPSAVLQTGVLVGRVDHMEPGYLRLDFGKKAFHMARRGHFLEDMTRICLDQGWLKNAAAHFLFMADLERIERNWGPRGYRYAMMTAGRLGQRIYLLSTAMGMGCCGIGAFYDQEAARLLNLKGAWRLLYLVAVGIVKKSTEALGK